MIGSRIPSLVIGGVLLLGACNGARDEADTGAPDADTAALGEMADMPGMRGMQGGMMEQMTRHVQAMRGVGVDSVRALLPMHRQMVANMIAQMNREMRDMNMTTDAQWSATVDSLRADLTRMPELSTQALRDVMPAHYDRVLRLMNMHSTMMTNMRM